MLLLHVILLLLFNSITAPASNQNENSSIKSNFQNPVKLLKIDSNYGIFYTMAPAPGTPIPPKSSIEYVCYQKRSEILEKSIVFENCMKECSEDKCDAETKPTLAKTDVICRNNSMLYEFRYKVCFEDEHTEKNRRSHVIVYSVCYNEIRKETLYTQHSISSYTLPDSVKLSSYTLQLQTNGDLQDVMERMARRYTQQIPRPDINSADTRTDYLIPQTLIPHWDMDLDFARNSNLHYLDTRPQWKRLNYYWNSINIKIWRYLKENQLLQHTTIHTATSPFLRTDKRTEEEYMKGKGLKISIPQIWAKLIKTSNGEAMVILLYNIHHTYLLQKDDLLCKPGICDANNWKGIEILRKFSNVSSQWEDQWPNVNIQCCKATFKVLGRFNLWEIANLSKITGVLKLKKVPDEENFQSVSLKRTVQGEDVDENEGGQDVQEDEEQEEESDEENEEEYYNNKIHNF